MPNLNENQFIDVYHASFSKSPPHKMSAVDAGAEVYLNSHPDVIHMGSREVTEHGAFKSRPYIHKYSVPKSVLYPVTFGDEQIDYQEEPRFTENMKGVQEGLFETVTGDPEFALSSKKVLPYRNRFEAHGSISYMVPKSLVHNFRGVRYQGVEDRYKWTISEIPD